MDATLNDPKQGEREYYRRIGEAGLAHSLGKPFTDEKCGEYLADLGALISLLPQPPARGLDLGCDAGWTSFFLARRGYEIVGVDIAPEAIQAATAKACAEGITNAQFLCADYEELRFQNEFDFAVFYDALHHAEDEAMAISKAYESLRPGACLLTIEPGRGHHLVETSRQAIAQYHVHEKEMHPAKIIRLARAAGFRESIVLPPAQQIHSFLYGHGIAAQSGNLPARLFHKLRAFYMITRMFLLPGQYGIVLLRK
jgi:SAM-dependent methyltransferase